MVSGILILQTCNLVVVLKQRLAFVPTSAQFLRRRHFLDTELELVSCIQMYRVSVGFVRCPTPNRSVKEVAVELSTLFLQSSLNSQILET